MFTWTWKILQWPVVFLLVATAVALVYYFAPDAEQEWIWITPGSVLATVLWVVASLAFRYYVTNFAAYNETYGAIGGVMVLLLWFYVSGIALLVGAELNAEIEHASPYGKDVGEKVPGEKKKIGPAAAARLRRTPREGRDRRAAVSRRHELRHRPPDTATREGAGKQSDHRRRGLAAGGNQDRPRDEEEARGGPGRLRRGRVSREKAEGKRENSGHRLFASGLPFAIPLAVTGRRV